MADVPAAGSRVFVRLQQQLGTVLGPSDNPVHQGLDEPVLSVRLDDGSVVPSGVSALGDPDEAQPVEEPEPEAAPPAAEAAAPAAASESSEEEGA